MVSSLVHLLTIGQKLYKIQSCSTNFWTHFVAVLNSILKKWKEKSSNAACAALYEAYRQIDLSEAQFACIPRKDSHNAGLRPTRSRCHNFGHLQHSCSSRAAVLLTCLEDIAQNYPSYCFSYIPEIRTIALFLPF